MISLIKGRKKVEADRAKAEDARRVVERKWSRRRSRGNTAEYLREKYEVESKSEGERVRSQKGRVSRSG